MKNKVKLLFLFLFVGVMSVAAQTVTITGTVLDEFGEAFPGVNVVIKGTTTGTSTDISGKYTLTVNGTGKVLVFSAVGYAAQEIPVEGQSAINVTLQEDTQQIDEVVVIGYGSVKKSTLTSAISKMDSKGLENRPLARAETALQGQLAGVAVRTTTGEPGADMQIRVRGASSIYASADPLYVVDGVPMNSLTGINPSDISSIEVLKDAASSAIYGSRGSNGVVLVSTKKGKSGKPVVSINASYGIQSLEKKMDLLSAQEWMEFYIKYNDQNYMNNMATKKITTASIKDDNATRMKNMGGNMVSPNYKIILDDRWFNYMSDDIKNAHTYSPTNEMLDMLDWQDEFYRAAAVQDYNLTVSGGSENTTYLFSGGYFNQEGIATGTDYERISFRTNLETKVNKYISLGINLAPTYTRSNGGGRADGKDSRAHHVLASAPVSEAGVGYMTNVEPNALYPWAGTTSSPTFYMDQNIRHEDILRVTGNAFLRITPISDLKIEFSGAANYLDADRQTYIYSSTSSNWNKGEGVNSSSEHYTKRNWSTLLQALVNYDKTFGDHTVNAMLGASAEKTRIGFTTTQGYSSFPNDAIQYSFDGSLVTAGTNKVEQSTPSNLASFFGRLSYSYADRYHISGSLRYDGGSIFGANNKWGLFPALSAGWTVSNEDFFQKFNLDWFNFLKLRASYGSTGNNSISNTAAYATLTALKYANVAGYMANSLGNPDLGWEKTHSTDLAVDMGFLKNRIQFSFDWYTKTTKDLLYQAPSMGASGFTSIWTNLGEIYNHGIDIELNTHNFIGAFKWSTSFNVSYNQNEVKSIGVDNTPIYAGFDSSNPSNILTVGQPINSFYIYDAIGVWRTQAEIDAYSAAHGGNPVTYETKKILPGDLRYRDVNDDGVFDQENDRVLMGSPNPTMTYGMTNNFSYKNFDLSILLTAQTGGKIYGLIGRAIDRPSQGPQTNAMGRWKDAWWSETEQGDGSVPNPLSTTTGGRIDSRWLYKSDYLRIKNLTLGYRLPINPAFISYARVYVSIENLYKWDYYYGGYSPEASNSASTSSPGATNLDGESGKASLGIDYGGYPIPRIFTIGLNVNF